MDIITEILNIKDQIEFNVIYRLDLLETEIQTLRDRVKYDSFSRSEVVAKGEVDSEIDKYQEIIDQLRVQNELLKKQLNQSPLRSSAVAESDAENKGYW